MVAWENEIEGYTYYIKLEKKLSDNTVEAYLRDLRQMAAYMESEFSISDPEQVREQHVESFLAYLYDKGVEKTTQARVLSGIKSFFNYLLMNDRIDSLPTEFIDTPKIGRKLPDVLSVDEVNAMLDSVDLSQPFGHRNRAIIETLYGCGLRVRELVTLRIGDLFFEDGFVRVVGKGDKQRLVPVGDGRSGCSSYLDQRPSLRVDQHHAETLFLRQKGRGLTRVMIYHIIREAVARPALRKISARIRRATRSPRICSRAARASVRCSRCSGTSRSSRPRFTPTSMAKASAGTSICVIIRCRTGSVSAGAFGSSDSGRSCPH